MTKASKILSLYTNLQVSLPPDRAWLGTIVHGYAPVICNHGQGPRIAGNNFPFFIFHSPYIAWVFFLCAKIAGITQWLGLQQGRVKYNSAGSNSRGFTDYLSQQCRAFSRDLLEEKSRSQLFPNGGGGCGNKWLLYYAVYFLNQTWNHCWHPIMTVENCSKVPSHFLVQFQTHLPSCQRLFQHLS